MKFNVKKFLLLCLLIIFAVPFCFGQIYRSEVEGKSGPLTIALHFLEYAQYRYLFYTESASIFLDEDNLTHLKEALEKFVTWEALAKEGRIAVTRTLDSIMFTTYYLNRSFVREAAFFHLIFTTTPMDTQLAAVVPLATDEDVELTYTLFVDTSMDAIGSFKLSSDQVKELLEALSPEKLAEAEEIYLQKKALEELFN